MAERSVRTQKLTWVALDLCVLIYALVPVLWVVSLSLKSPAFVTDGHFIPFHITLQNYQEIFQKGFFTKALMNSVAISLLATVCSVLISILAAYVFARIPLTGKTVVFSLIMLVQIFPQISLITPIFNLERALGLFDTWLGLIIPYTVFSLPLAIVTLSSYFRHLPKDLEQAAIMDGADYWSMMRKIIFPLAMPGVVTAAIMVFIFCWNDLLFALSLTATDVSQTAPVAISGFSGSSQFEQPIGSIAAGAVIITIPVVLFVVIFQHRIVSGLTSGAVKG